MLKKKALILVVVVFFIGVIVKIFVLDNPMVLCVIAEGFDEPSRPYYLIIGRIYRLAQSNELTDKFVLPLNTGQDRNLHESYVRILGVIGDYEALSTLIKVYTKHQHNREPSAILEGVVKSMGVLGDTQAIPLLETLLKERERGNVQVSSFEIANALYLLTGNTNYYFTNSRGEKQHLYLTERQKEARDVILASKDRRRTAEEMIIMDRLFRPSGW